MQDAGVRQVPDVWAAEEQAMLATFPRMCDDLAGPAMDLTPRADVADDVVFGLDGLTPLERDAVFDVDFEGDDHETLMDIISSFETVLAGPGGDAAAAGATAPTSAADEEPRTVIAVPVQAAAPRKRRAPGPTYVAATPAAGVAAVSGDEAPARKRVAATDAPRGARGGGGPQRTVPWRRVGSPENERMQAAVWVYRFAPAVKSKTIQREFGVAVKSLMRYVYDSCAPEYAAYRLYFGAAGETVAGMADRAVPKDAGRVTAASIGYVPDGTAAGVPELARSLLAMLGH